MKGRIIAVLFSAMLVFAFVSACFAADQDFNRFGVRLRGLYVMPNEHVDNALKPLGIELTEAVAPELDLEYFATKNISAELVLALVKTDVMTQNGGINNGSLWLLPPSFFLKYHFMPNCKISPYAGVGFNVVMPFDERLNIGGVKVPFKVDTTIGWAAKLGADVPIAKSTYLNVDAMYYNVPSSMNIAGSKFNLELNPFIISTGIGVRF